MARRHRGRWANWHCERTGRTYLLGTYGIGRLLVGLMFLHVAYYRNLVVAPRKLVVHRTHSHDRQLLTMSMFL
jgi:hypothetical protein